jgi:hypothetical protein
MVTRIHERAVERAERLAAFSLAGRELRYRGTREISATDGRPRLRADRRVRPTKGAPVLLV